MVNSFLHTRRGFLLAAGAAAAPAAKPKFEVSASLYPWELHDEGIDSVFENLQGMAAVNSVYLIALMHKEKRPRTSDVFPHNPKRKTWYAEDARVYWRPEASRYGRIQPRGSDVDWLSKTDWLNAMIAAARKRGLKTGVEISHSILDGERIRKQFPDCVQRDINGKPLSLWEEHVFPVCFNHPDVRQYVLGLWCDLAANYDVDYLQNCTIPFSPGGPATGGCFCDSCRRAAGEAGFDLEQARRELLANPNAVAPAAKWQAFRQNSTAALYKVLSQGVHAIKPRLDVRLNEFMRNTEPWGVNLLSLKPYLNSIRAMDYSEQLGDPGKMDGKRKWLTQMRGSMGKGFPILSAVAVRPKATPELIRQGVHIAIDCGMDGITLGHYDGSEFPMLRAVGEALRSAKVA